MEHKEEDQWSSIDFFLRNFRIILANKENYNDNLKEFINEEEKFLFTEITNISLMTRAVAPNNPKKIKAQ